jgi:predicted dehydrogenase
MASTGQDGASGIHEHADYRQMLERLALDPAGVATPGHLHGQPVVDAIARRVRRSLCEKPLATPPADADRIVEAVERSGPPGLIDHTRCSEPYYADARARVRADSPGVWDTAWC